MSAHGKISPRMSGLIVGLYEDWIALDERIDTIASESPGGSLELP
jgi:hypothetical protein